MSNALSIAAVTTALVNLLDNGISAVISSLAVTAKPPDRARGSNTGNQLNIFLYQVVPNATWRNLDMPGQAKPGETGSPPLGLDLYYLISASGTSDDDQLAHQVLGLAMQILHDHILFTPAELKAALPESDLYEQVERVHITHHPLSPEEMSKLWTMFSTGYRVSAAYRVSVVLIESTKPVKAPLPVLTIGPGDSGVLSQPDLLPPFATLTDVIPPHSQPAALLGDILTVKGFHLRGSALKAIFRHPRLATPIEVTPPFISSAIQFTVKIPSILDDPLAPAKWPAGLYILEAVVSLIGRPDQTSNAWPFALAPKITTALPFSVASDVSGDATINLTCEPEVRPEQRAALLLGDREVLADPHPTLTGALTFVVKSATVGEFTVRLRVDGVDSLIIDYEVQPPAFITTQKVTIT